VPVNGRWNANNSGKQKVPEVQKPRGR
jgi:hypothetical protein